MLALPVCDLWCFEDWEEKDQSLNKLIKESVSNVFLEQPETIKQILYLKLK